ncbi:ABC transporter permease [Methylobacterium oryzisoli]|uniref:ABC transporter permease n=1 Tax=Methylobacterium oryzisoli TaxID=3385502 RepID=UPI0038914F79
MAVAASQEPQRPLIPHPAHQPRGASRVNHSKPTTLDIQLQVLSALILRDMRTRFGRTIWGNLVVVLWPSAHVLIIVATMALRGMAAPLGESAVLFIFTGMGPMVVFMYLSRKMMEGVTINRPLLSFPDVKFLDLCMSRAVVEIMNIAASIVITMLIVAALGIDPLPEHAATAIAALLGTFVFALGIGLVNASIVTVFPPYMVGFALVIITMYGLSGVFFVPDGMPEDLYNVFMWNPMTHAIMWFRSAYYPGYGEDASPLYVIMTGACLIFLGLLCERAFTRKSL